MSIDFEELKKELCDEFGYDEDEFDSEDEIHKGIEKLKSMTEEEIDKIIQALWHIMDELYEDFENHDIYSYDISEITDYFKDIYFEVHPNEKKQCHDDDDNEFSDAFFEFMKNHPDFSTKVGEFFVQIPYILDEFHKEAVIKVSEDFGLPSEIIEIIRRIEGISP